MPEGSNDLRVSDLELQVRALLDRVVQLEEQVQQLESAENFEVVDQPPSHPTAKSASRPAAGGSSSRAAVDPDRLQKLRNISSWLDLTLKGEHRGGSGRDALAGPSRYYLIVRDFSGADFSPAKVVSPWSRAVQYIKRGDQFGASVFIGLPRWEDAEKVAEFSGLTLEAYDGGAASRQ